VLVFGSRSFAQAAFPRTPGLTVQPARRLLCDKFAVCELRQSEVERLARDWHDRPGGGRAVDRDKAVIPPPRRGLWSPLWNR